MTFIWNLWNFFYVVLTVYSFLILGRIFLSWLPQVQGSPLVTFLSKVTDPYLDFFKRMGIFRIGKFDLSSLVGLSLLNLVSALVQSLRDRGEITFGFVLALILSMLWNLLSFVFAGLAVLALIRAVSLFLNASSNPFWSALDKILKPVSAWFIGLFTRKIQKYTVTLLLVAATGGLLWAGGQILIDWLIRICLGIPF